MRITHLTYARTDYKDPERWLRRINFFVALLEQMASEVEVSSIHCINYSGILKRNSVEYHFLKRSKFQFYYPVELHRYVKTLEPQIVIIHGFNYPWQVLWLRWQLGDTVQILIQHHSEKPLRHYKGVLQKVVDRFVKAYFFPSFDQARPWVTQKQIRSLEKVYEIMEVPSVFYPIDKLSAKAKTKVTGTKIYLWVGRFDANKDPLTLLKAFISFAERNPHAKLYVIFQQNDLIEEVKDLLIEANEIAKQIILVGKVEHNELLFWYNSADFIISTSRYEGMGVAVSEAMSCGCVPILTNISSFRAMTKNEDFGLLFEAGNDSDLALALNKSLSIDLEKQREKTLDQYKSNLSAEAISNKMITVFKKALKN